MTVTDQQRADTIHALGNEIIRTPNLDRLARGSMATRLVPRGAADDKLARPKVLQAAVDALGPGYARKVIRDHSQSLHAAHGVCGGKSPFEE